MNKESKDETEILQSHFENKILKSARYKTKYPNKAGKYDEKEQKYFIASFYKDAKITESKEFKNGFIKTPCAMESCPKTPTTFATLFSKNTSDIYPEQIFECFNPKYTYCGFIYKDFNTAFWSKADNNNQQILAECDGDEGKIKELCEKGVKRKDIYKKRKEKQGSTKDYEKSHYAYGESIHPGGKDAPKDYLQRMDFLRHRIEQDVEKNDCKKLTQTNSRVKTKPCNFDGENEGDVRYKNIYSDDNELTLGAMGNTRYSGRFGMYSYYHNHIVFNKKTKQLNEKTACNEFVSLRNEEVSSLMLYIKHLNSNQSLDEKVMNAMLENYGIDDSINTEYSNELANVVSNIKKMLFAQKDLGIPYMPILGGDGKVLCVKLSVVLQALKDTDLYKKKGEKYMSIIDDEEIESLQQFECQKIEELKSTLKNNNKYASGQHNTSSETSNKEHSNDVSNTQQKEQSENRIAINKVLQQEGETIGKQTPSKKELQWWNPLTWNCNCCNDASQINREEQAEKELILNN